MEDVYIVPGTELFEDIPKIYVSEVHKGYMRITLIDEDNEISITNNDVDCISKVYDMINKASAFSFRSYQNYLTIADINGFDLDKALRKTVEHAWNNSNHVVTKCFDCYYKEDDVNSLSFSKRFQFVDKSYNDETSGNSCLKDVGDCELCVDSYSKISPYGARSPVSFEEYIKIVQPIPLKEFDMLDKRRIILKCKIKDVQTPKLNEFGNSYIQYVTVYADDTRKTIKAYFNSGCYDFDKWNNGDSVVLMGRVNNREERPLQISRAMKLETEEIINVPITRSQETPGYDTWRSEVIRRDNVCQCCGLDKHLEAHHMFGYKEHPELATDVNNGVVLCKFCHDKYHSIYGLKNINPRDLVEFIKDFGVVRK